ncbi:MAG: acyl-CoA/acyl-ACP dehydrogenase [Proteobacteria bacterium]|nr:acyl-CoA/acyl-ACP dehydrogenase [Pseudomonadota bacterium]
MGHLELDLNLSDEAKAAGETARRFGLEVMRPAGEALDKLADPADVIAPDSILWDVFRQFRQLGFHRGAIPAELGGMAEEIDSMAGVLIAEAMGYGDAGLAVSLGASAFPFRLAALSPAPEVREFARAYCEDQKAELIGCWAITEPDHGSDWIMGMAPTFDDPRCAPSVRAVLKGDEYIVSGQKAAWVSNGTIATHAALHVCLDPSKGMQGSGLAVIPLDLPGISRGKPLDKMGQRPLNQGELFFEEVRIPTSHMVVPDPAMMAMVARIILASANGGMGIIFAGLAQAVYDEALKYARQRVQGGVPIFEHQNVKLKLFDMFIKTEAARAYARRMALYNALNSLSPSCHHAVAAKLLSTQTAFEVAAQAIQVFGGNGLSREYPIEKMFRDAKAAMIEDGENSALAIAAAADL